MGDYKRSSPTTSSAMETSSGAASMSKKRKTSVGSCELQLCSSGVQLPSTHLREYLLDMTVSPASSVNSAGTVVSGEFFPQRFLSCCSSNMKTSPGVTENTATTTLDLEAKGFETVESTYGGFKLFRDRCLLSESSGDSEETMMLPAKSPAAAAASKLRNIPAVKMPPQEEIEEFFAMAEKYEQKRFAEKYNYDIAEDMPLEGRYQWVRLN